MYFMVATEDLPDYVWIIDSQGLSSGPAAVILKDTADHGWGKVVGYAACIVWASGQQKKTVMPLWQWIVSTASTSVTLESIVRKIDRESFDWLLKAWRRNGFPNQAQFYRDARARREV